MRTMGLSISPRRTPRVEFSPECSANWEESKDSKKLVVRSFIGRPRLDIEASRLSDEIPRVQTCFLFKYAILHVLLEKYCCWYLRHHYVIMLWFRKDSTKMPRKCYKINISWLTAYLKYDDDCIWYFKKKKTVRTIRFNYRSVREQNYRNWSKYI